jgi:hypothetical protein
MKHPPTTFVHDLAALSALAAMTIARGLLLLP